jgi:hypothetical protein
LCPEWLSSLIAREQELNMDEPLGNYRQLDSQRIIETVQALQGRIEKRFPGSGLSKVVAELYRVATETVSRTQWIQRPHLPLRFAALLLSVAVLALVVLMVVHIHQFRFNDYTNFIQALEASISSVVFIGAAILFFVSWENRIKRSRSLKAVHELRALAHIIDMHQLTKDPESYFAPALNTAVRRSMTPFELNRYLDYCSESLALISKIAALYVQGFQDAVLLDAVDDVEDLTAGFSRKIWQKITILENFRRSGPPEEAKAATQTAQAL